MEHWRTLALPSNSFIYSDIVEIKELDFNYMLSADSPFVTSSETDLMYYTIKKYSNIAHPEDLFLSDAIYIHNMIQGLSSNITEKKENHTCNFCGEKHLFHINLGDLNVKKLNEESKEFLYAYLEWKNGQQFEVKYRRRKLGDNIRSGNNIFEISDDTKLVEKIVKYFQGQFVSIRELIDGAEDYTSLSDFEYVLTQIGIDGLITFLNTVKKDDFGFDSQMTYNCKSCSSKNTFDIFDPFTSCIMVPNSLSQDERAISKIKELIILKSYNVLTLNELLSIPLSDFDFWSKKIIEVKNLSSGKVDYFSEHAALNEFGEGLNVG